MCANDCKWRVLGRLWFCHLHVHLKFRLNREMEEEGIAARDGLPPPTADRRSTAVEPPSGGAPQRWCPGSGQREACNNPLLLHIAVPNSFSTMAKITPTTRRELQRTQRSLVFSPNGCLPYCVVCYAPQHQQQNGYPNNKEVYNTCVSVRIHTHARTAVAHCLIGGPNSLGVQSREGEVTWPLMTTYGAKFGKSARLSFHLFKGGARYLLLVFHVMPVLATGGP